MIYYMVATRQEKGTLRPYRGFDPEYDCETLKTALEKEKSGIKEESIMNILCFRSSEQRQIIKIAYRAMYGQRYYLSNLYRGLEMEKSRQETVKHTKTMANSNPRQSINHATMPPHQVNSVFQDLVEELHSELKGDLEDVMVGLMYTRAEFDATELRQAMKGFGTKESVIIEILTSRTNAEIRAINRAYQQMFERDLENDIRDETSVYLKQLLVLLSRGQRDEGHVVAEAKAKLDAQRLYNAGEKEWGTDESVFNVILATQSYAQLHAVFKAYETITVHDIEKAIEKEFKGDAEDALLAVVKCVRNKQGYFAEKLYKAMKGFGTDDRTLQRIIIGRCEIDMMQIKEQFQEIHGKSLESVIECYRKCEKIFYRTYSESMKYFTSTQQQGTVVPYPEFDPKFDCQRLKNAMDGCGSNDKVIMNILCFRSNEQRQEIKSTFETMYGKELVKELNSELSGNFEDVIVGLMNKPAEFDAVELRDAMEGLGTKESTLIEILTTRNNKQILAIKQTYWRMFVKELETDIREDTSLNFKELMVSLCTGGRGESNQVNELQAKLDAQKLFSAGENTWGTDESVFNAILASQNFAQLQLVFQAYEQIAEHDMEVAIHKEFSGDIEDGLLAIVKCVKNKPGFFAERLRKSMKRIIISRCEVDMVQIKEQFLQMYEKTLESCIEDDTSGDYKSAILDLVRG